MQWKLTCILTVLTLASCGKGESEYPPPGEMRVVSITPLEITGGGTSAKSVEVGNLIANGDFSEWWPGAPTGIGFHAPDSAYSNVSRGGDGVRNYAVQQWLQPDDLNSSAGLFRTQVSGLSLGELQQLSIAVSGNVEPGALIALFAGTPPEDKPTHPGLITLMPNRIEGMGKLYRAEFAVPEGAPLSVASALSSKPKGESLRWHGWRLEAAGEVK